MPGEDPLADEQHPVPDEHGPRLEDEHRVGHEESVEGEGDEARPRQGRQADGDGDGEEVVT